MPDLPASIYSLVAAALVGALGILSGAIRRMYLDGRERDRQYTSLAERSIATNERSTLAIDANTQALKAMRDETLAVYRTLARAARPPRGG